MMKEFFPNLSTALVALVALSMFAVVTWAEEVAMSRKSPFMIVSASSW
jgi:hypothetical protein